ncbi:hypothetical protein DX914_05530 [Lysobacter silvisoli]|uniref:Uncharacterized protein n=1 Tax=Lysobacter silvisoli TaxID=2293254 RepID=A0A371K3S9_9GAMM|nr:hypothetical protein DX914_05530 [Lysobacter silvisoli]
MPLPPPQTPDPKPKPAAPPAPYLDISITTLSKGRGVPEPTREAYQRVRALMDHKQREQQLSGLSVRRMGLEGETRLCARFSDAAQAREALAEIRELTAGVELIAVESTPCIPSKEDAP